MNAIGVLAIQGDVEAHAAALVRVGATARPVLRSEDLETIDALILPGGESTTIAKGIDRLGLGPALRAFTGPVLGTCAGAILMARGAQNHPVPTLGLIDVVAQRNAYGTQVDSFSDVVDPDAREGLAGLRCVFIRAPQLRELGSDVEVLATHGGVPVLVRQGRHMAATFHPELTPDTRVHELLVQAI